MQQRYQGTDVHLLGLHSGGDSPADLEAFLAASQITFPVLRDAAPVYQAYRQVRVVSPYPLDYVIDRDGRVAYIGTEYDPAALVAVVDSLLARTAPVPRPAPGGPALRQGAGTSLRLTLAAPAEVGLDLFDARGRRVRRLLAGESLAAGVHALDWDGRDAAGRRLPAGVYLARALAGGRAAVAKLFLVR